MKLCVDCSRFVSLQDILTNSERLNSELIIKGQKCEDCGKKE